MKSSLLCGFETLEDFADNTHVGVEVTQRLVELVHCCGGIANLDLDRDQPCIQPVDIELVGDRAGLHVVERIAPRRRAPARRIRRAGRLCERNTPAFTLCGTSWLINRKVDGGLAMPPKSVQEVRFLSGSPYPKQDVIALPARSVGACLLSWSFVNPQDDGKIDLRIVGNQNFLLGLRLCQLRGGPRK